jgi:biotin carboxyl carrier protein
VIYDVEINGRTRRIELKREGQSYLVAVDGRQQLVDAALQSGIWSFLLTDLNPAARGATSPLRRSHEIAIAESPSGDLIVHVDGRVVTASVAGARGSWARRGQDGGGGGAGPHRITAPMPGKVVKLLVGPGDSVAAGQGVVVIEAMKMENELRSAKAGTVKDVRAAEGTSVEAGTVLVVVE